MIITYYNSLRIHVCYIWIYMVTFTINIPKCKHIYHTWILWVIYIYIRTIRCIWWGNCDEACGFGQFWVTHHVETYTYKKLQRPSHHFVDRKPRRPRQCLMLDIEVVRLDWFRSETYQDSDSWWQLWSSWGCIPATYPTRLVSFWLILYIYTISKNV